MNKHDKNVINELCGRKSANRVLIYGNMAYAVASMHFLHKHGIEIEAFIVDRWADNSIKEIEGIPIKPVEEYISRVEEYDVVIGFQSIEKCRVMLGLKDWLKTNVYMLWEPVAHIDWSHEWYSAHKADFEAARSYLADEVSKKTLDALIDARELGNIEPLMKLAVPNQYFNYLTYEKELAEEVFLDCGAFNGDTIRAYNQFTSGKFKKITAFEPDKLNTERIKSNTKDIHDVTVIQKGLWNCDTTLHFTSDSSESRIEEAGAISVDVTSIDSVMQGERVSFIKMDIEGAEYEALCGAEKTIRRWMPKLAICVYHKCDDIFKFISYLNKFGDDGCKYAFYLRHHTCAAYETVLYAVPQIGN